MKKRVFSLLLATCLVMPCMFALSACGGGCEEHDYYINQDSKPTVSSAGMMICQECMEEVTLPSLNDTDYEVDDKNPDHVIYTYSVGKQTFRFYDTNFAISGHELENGICQSFQIIEYYGNNTDVVVPEIYGIYSQGPYTDRPVKCVGLNAFMGNTTIQSITLPEGVNYIDKNAFANCSNLKYISIASTEMTIDARSFNGCTKLEEVLYKGTKEQWDNVSISDSFNNPIKNAKVCYYSETAPTVEEYIENDFKATTWHYDANNRAVKWQLNNTNFVDGKSYTYSHSEVAFADEYWLALKQAEQLGILGDMFDNDAEQIEMVTTSQTKEEYQTKFANWYAGIYSTQTVVSFAEGKITYTIEGNPYAQIEYVELEGVICNTTQKEKTFTYDSATGNIYEGKSDQFSSIKHVYTVVE